MNGDRLRHLSMATLTHGGRHTLTHATETVGIDAKLLMMEAELAAEHVTKRDYAHDYAEIKASEHQPTGSSSRAEAQGRNIEPGRPAAERAGAKNGLPADSQEGARSARQQVK